MTHPTPSGRRFSSQTTGVVVAVVLAKLVLLAPIGIEAALAVAARPAVETLTGCLEAGTDRGTFVLTHVRASDDDSASATPLPDRAVMSTTTGLTAHVGHTILVRGQAGTHPRFGGIFRIRSLTMVRPTCQ